MKKLIFLFLIGLCANFLAAQTEEKTEFEKTLQKHLQAINDKNFNEFKSTITEKNEINLILPNGIHFSTRSQFLNFTKAWFQENTWEMKYTILSLKETSEMGFVLLMVNYSDIDENKNPYSIVYYLNLIFEKQNGKWKLVHDQNTMCYDKK